MKEIEVVAAIIKHQGKIFCAQRNINNKSYLSYKYEFPGGKTNPGETKPEALEREIKEELSWNIDVHDLFITVNHAYPDFRISMHAYLCTAKDLEFNLNEHTNFVWLPVNKLDTLDWAAADIPIVDMLMGNE